MAAVSIALAFSFDSLKQQNQSKKKFNLSSRYPSLYSSRSRRSSLRFASLPSSSHSASVSTATETGEEEESPTTTKSTSSYDFLEETFRTGRFLSNSELEKLKSLEGFAYFQELETGTMWVRVMRQNEMDSTVNLLAESFGESMLLPSGYQSVLRFLVKQYLIERREVLPHAVTLVGFFRKKTDSGSDDGEEEEEEEEAEMAGTVEVCLDKRGANASPPSPTPPKESPYVCNMTVKEGLRRRGIGWHLLKASEELISQLSPSKDVYLHCRMIDEAPFNMYKKAGYEVVKTDTVLVLLMLQRRKHLMRKKLPPCAISSSDTVGSDNKLTSSATV